jgi:hypothetical protein
VIADAIHKGYSHSTAFWGLDSLIYKSSFDRSNDLLSEDRPSISMGSSSLNSEKRWSVKRSPLVSSTKPFILLYSSLLCLDNSIVLLIQDKDKGQAYLYSN